MRPEAEYRGALALIDQGLNDSEISRSLGIPRGTIRDWRVGRDARSGGRTRHWAGRRHSPCPRCDDTYFDEEAYSYLLGVYLGDGCLSEHARDVFKLRIVCDLRYPDIINEIASHIVITRGVDRIGFARKEGCVEIYAFWKHWVCLFPQHGPGRKHLRLIELERWQQEIVAEYPQALIRGLIQSDGSRHINAIVRPLKDGPKRYEYARYMFTNASDDIRDILTDALAGMGVSWSKTTPRVISVARREDVAFLDTFVGPKS